MTPTPAITDPPSPIKTSSPIKPAEEKDDDVTITGHGYTEPGKPTVLSKHSAKEEIPITDKSKWSVNMDSYASFSAQEIHSGYLNRLYTSRDYEAGLVNLMKERYEVNTVTPFHMNIVPLAAKFIGYARITTKKDTSVTFWAERIFFSIMLMTFL